MALANASHWGNRASNYPNYGVITSMPGMITPIEAGSQPRTVNFRFAGLLTLPALSVALTLKTCLPGFSFL